MLRIDLEDVSSWLFPAGEVGIRLDTNVHKSCKVIARLRNSDDILKLIMLTDAIDRHILNDQYAGWYTRELVMPYVPYGRQDRACNPGESFSLEAFARIINSLGYEKVTVYDAHSKETKRLIHNCKEIMPHSLYCFALKGIQPNRPVVIAPDKGALSRAYYLQQFIGLGDAEVFSAHKKRELSTGKIISYAIEGDFTGMDCLVPDDIIDGAGTYVALAAALKAQGARSVHLIVSHGIFSKGLEHIYGAGVDTIWTTDSYYRDDASRQLDLDSKGQVYKLYNEI